MTISLLFGVPELDRMLDLKRGHFYQENSRQRDHDRLASIALLGPDGTGKSVFALHLVSRYYADTYALTNRPKILYVSTDLRYEKAKTVWTNFALDVPYQRDIPCERASDRKERKRKQPVESFELQRLRPVGKEVAEFLGPARPAGIGFIDMASSSAGDDWGYVIRAFSLLDRQDSGHLVVIDSVAGFETLIGDTDAYGEKSTRRARIAAVLRAAQNRCHLVFVVEEPQEGCHLPEEFVADTVIRLRRRTVGGTTRRTLEIEKARGRAHAGGEHQYGILDGLGSSTGVWENPDEPRSGRHDVTGSASAGTRRTNNYVQVYYSLQYRNQRIKARPGPGSLAPAGKRASFGIHHLDDLLGGDGDKQGLRCGKICSVIGDAGTGKSTLAYSFLCEGFRSYAEQLVLLTRAVTEGIQSGNFNNNLLKETFGRIEHWLTEKDSDKIRRPSTDLRKIQSAEDLVQAAKDREEQQRPKAEKRSLGKKSDVLVENRLNIWQTWARARDLDDKSSPDPPLRRVQYPWSWAQHEPRQPIEIADWLLRHPACASPGILIATRDVKADELARRFVLWLRPVVESAISGPDATPMDYDKPLFNYIAQHLICRRLDSDDATAPVLFHIIEQAILEAQRLLYGPILPNTAEERTIQSWRIRLVIDNLRIVRDMYPAVGTDPLFLPLLAFYLGREGLTSVMVDTDSGRPDKDPSDEINRELRSLVTHQLYTWQVPFFGQKRIAIAAVPSVSARHKGIIREVKLENDLIGGAKARPEVDPHFELYSGLEESRPQAVPLSVILYAETPAVLEYVRRENLFFKQVFPSVGESGPSSDIVVGRSTSDYEALRDYCHMPTDLCLDHSLVFQVDGFWSLRRNGSLENQYRYLRDVTTTRNGCASMEDPFHLFQPASSWQPRAGGPDQRVLGPSGKVPLDRRAGTPKLRQPPSERVDYFENKYYRHRVELLPERAKAPIEQQRKVDRIPFTWDFGFLLCKVDPWRLAAEKPLKTMVMDLTSCFKETKNGALVKLKNKLDQSLTVGTVWNILPKTIDALTREENASQPRRAANVSLQASKRNGLKYISKGQAKINIRLDSWRAFLEAAREVADAAADRLGHPVQPFDFASMAGDSVSSMVLEIWFSEIWQRGRVEQSRILKAVSQQEYFEPDKLGLVNLLSEDQSIFETYEDYKKRWTEEPSRKKPQLREELKGYSFELYMSWLLLLEVLDFSTFHHPSNPFDFRPDRSPTQEAVAARHWYKTACVAAARGEETGHPSELMVGVRLPGHFSVRGDWFLATSKGSRSARLAERALDVLSSRRANIIRLQMGLGLPTRDILDENQIGQLRTGLRGPDEKGIIDNVKYENLFQKLAARHDGQTESEIDNKDFYWLWRSGLQDYDGHSRPWRKWLNRIFLWTHHYHRQHSSGWIGGFKPYDQLQRGDYSQVINFDSFLQFAEMCDLLIAELKAAAPEGNRPAN